MRPSTPHFTTPADLQARLNQPRIQTGVVEHEGNAIHDLIFVLLFEAIAVLVAIVLWHFSR